MNGPSLAQKVSNIKHMPVLLAATSATKDPADGYLVKDIVKMTFESQQTRLFLQQYLLNQLITTNNVFTKIKVLRLFLVLMEEGHIEFKRNLRKTPEPFNEASKLRPHQPKNQNLVAECGRIRDMANKVLDLLYTEVPEMRQSSSTFNPASSSSSSSSSFSSSTKSAMDDGTGTRITGFGNTGPASKTTTTDKLKALFGSSGGKSSTITYDPNYATMDPVPHNVSSSAVSSTSSQYNSGLGPVGTSHEPGHAGGGWGESEDSPQQQPRAAHYRHKPTSQWSYQREEDEREHLSSTGQDLSVYEESSIEQEQRLVDDITAPGGVRAAPPRDTLNKFISRCKNLDCQSVVDCLRLKLSSDEVQTVLRALFVVEALLRSDISDISSHMDIILEDLGSLSNSPNSSIKAKANKILVQLTAANDVPSKSSSVPTTQQVVPSSSGGEDLAEEEESSGVASIFSGLSMSGEKKPQHSRQSKKPPRKQATPTTGQGDKTTPPRKRVEKTEKSAFGDILGLGDLSAEAEVTEAPPTDYPNGGGLEGMMMAADDEEPPPEDDSLLTFEEDVEFDPLKRSDSVGSSLLKSGSFSSKRAAQTTSEQQPGQQQQPRASKNEAISSNPPPLVPQDSAGLLGDLTGVELDPASVPSGHAPQQLQQTSTVTMAMTSGSGMVAAYPQGMIQMVPATAIPTTAIGQQGQIPLAMQGGVAYGGVAPPGMVPVMYAPQGTTPAGLMYQPQIGGVARPVQRAAAAKEQTPPPDAGFSFLGKSNKSSAFDFVQDEMKATKTKK